MELADDEEGDDDDDDGDGKACDFSIMKDSMESKTTQNLLVIVALVEPYDNGNASLRDLLDLTFCCFDSSFGTVISDDIISCYSLVRNFTS